MINIQKLKTAQATKLLNSTPLGQVMGERQISRHLLRAGSRISADSENKTINLIKYAAWLHNELAAKKTAPHKTRSYDEIKEAARQRAADASSSGRDIGDLPLVTDQKRKMSCKNDLKKFLETYFPKKFCMSWSEDHIIVINKIEQAVTRGGLFALAMPRGTGKTSICERAAIWAVAYGHRRYVALIGATEEAACGNLDEIKMEFECNDLLMEDFPEICFPIRKLDGIANRCNGQTCNGRRTRITWTDGEIVLPSISDAPSAGTVIQVRGITGRLRGMKAALPSGESLRPELVIIDDPQTDESAASPEQNRKRIRILSSAILGLGGPGVKIAGVMPCTVIRPGDMADEILNRDKHPEWNGERRKLMTSMPENMTLWNKYAEIWADSLRTDGTIVAATDFYCRNQTDMDAGAHVSWPARFEPGEISGIQYAMNLLIRDKDAFYSEYQNEPVPDDDGDVEKISTDDVWNRMNHRQRGEIPEEAEHITMFIDVQGKILFWIIVAFAEDFTSWVIDYGAYPEQHRRYFSLRDVNPTFQQVYPNAGLEGAIFGALGDLTNMFLSRAYTRTDGAVMYIHKCVIDSAWGTSTKTVYRFCKESPHARILIPSKGRGITAAQKPFSDYRAEFGARLGFNWRIFRIGNSSTRLFEYDTNFWKSFFRTRLLSAVGDPGSLTVFGSDKEMHRMLAEHWSSEVSTPTSGGGRKVDIWKLIPGRENHWLDGIVGCMAAASTLGCELNVLRTQKKQKKKNSIKKIVPSGRIVPHR